MWDAPASVKVSPVLSSSTIWKPLACTSPASKNFAASTSLAKSPTILIAAGCGNTGFCQTWSRNGEHSKRLRLYALHSAFFSAQDFSQAFLFVKERDFSNCAASLLATAEISPIRAVVLL